MFDADLQVPQRGLLLHVGPHKTGTTAIQGALHAARKRIAEHDVVYAGTTRHHQMAALAVTGGRGLSGAPKAQEDDWNKLVRAAHAAAEQRVVISSEFFDDATDEVAKRVVDDLGGERVHVVVTLRPLAKILSSAWQQSVRNRTRTPYPEWLDTKLVHPENEGPRSLFWQRHHHDVQVQRWVSVVGPERVLVIVVDESEPEMLMRTFERLLDLPTGILQPQTGVTNRSLTGPETELIRAINIEFTERQWQARVYDDVVHHGIVKELQRHQPARGEARITTPAWAVQRANEIAAAAAQRIAASGARVLGDLSLLSAVRPDPAEAEAALDHVSLTVGSVRNAIVGVIGARNAAERAREKAKEAAAAKAEQAAAARQQAAAAKEGAGGRH